MIRQEAVPRSGYQMNDRPDCKNPQIESNADIGRPIFETDIGIENGPICTGHRVSNLQRCPKATAAKIDPETAPYILSSCIWNESHAAA